MTDSEEGDVDLPQQRKIRTSQHKALNRVMRTLTNLRDKDTPIILSLQILQEKETELATISRRLQRCNDYLVDDELDEELQGQDDTAFTVIETGIQEAKQLCQELIVFKTASCLSQEIEDSLQEVEDQKAANPEMDYSDWYPDIKKLIDEMAESLRGSTLASDHDLRRGIKQHKAKLGSIRATEAAPRRRDHKHVLDDKYKLNKITVPPFTGGLENWHSFWAKFKSAVHTQPGLSDEVKSIHLHDSIKDPSLEEYMRAASVNHVPYDAIIENLKQRYNKPRELHGIYCQKLVNLQPIKGTPSELSRAADTVFAAVTGLIAGGQSTINHIATSLVAPILPKQLRMEWETKTEKTEGVADVFEWIDFMRNKSSSVDHEQKQPQQTYSRAPKDSKPKEYQKSQKKYIESEGRVHVATSQPAAEVESTPPKGKNQATKAAAHSCSVPCTLCSTLHYLFQCRQFQEMTVAQRKTHIQSSNICSNCLRPGHILANCQSTFRCRLCKLQHNTLLHTDTTTTTGTVHRVSQIFKNDVNPPKENKKMVMTSLVKLTGPTGKSMNVRAMLDSGAEVCLLSSRVMQQLQLKRSNEWMTVGGVEPRETPIPRPTTCITVTSLFREDWSRKVKVTVLPKVTPDIAQHSLKFLKDLPQVQGLPMADPFFYESKKVDLILDVEFLDNVLLPRTIKGLPGTPSAWKTQLGWGLMGGYNLDAISHCTVATVQISSQESETGRMDTLLERSWEIEDLPRGIPAHSAQEIAVQKHYQETHVFSPPAGRYMVSLPKRDTTLQLGESKSSALNRYFGIEQSMLKKGTWSQFQDVIQEYLDLGLSAEELKNHQLWWEGPPWLKEDPILIPPQPQAADLDRHKGEEAKPMAVYVVKATLVSGWEHKFTSYKSMLHVTAYLFRFCRNLKARIKNQSTVTDATLTVEELQKAETYLFKQSQARTFGVEIGRLSAAKPAPMARNSSLKLVHPILNKEGILQVGGRLNKSSLTPLQKHPIILSSSDWMTKLVFKHYHELLLHCGPTLLLAHTAQMLYINGAKKLARAVCQNCLVCRRKAPRAQAQLMGQLPAVRVNPSLTFSHSGVDYAGPFLIKRGNPRSPTVTKAYLALFVCLVTKAVHIEVVSSQSTDALIAALHRFINRKGRPQHMFSDHGSNFVGAKSELRDWYNFLSLPSTDLSIKEALLSTRVTWHHIPERAPHFGGIWEAVVKSAKHHLKRIMGPVKLTFEEMTTITCQVEGCLNSRPYLAQDSHDSEGEVPLTPAHFLIGRPIQAYPEDCRHYSVTQKSMGPMQGSSSKILGQLVDYLPAVTTEKTQVAQATA